jgi:alkylhydroperoxidase/carboxymuconolactone decarboxylase family protein YurZ
MAGSRWRSIESNSAKAGTRRHIHNALQAGATMDEIMEMLQLCVAQGVQSLNLGVPILAEKLARRTPA